MITASGRALLVAGASLLAVGWAGRMWPMIVIGLVLLGMVAIAWLAFGARHDVEIERSLDRARVTRDDPALAEIVARNPGARSSGAFVAFEPAGRETLTVPVPSIPAGSGRTLRYRLPTDRRCVLPVGPLRIERSDPFLLVRARRPVAEQTVLYVHPRRWRLTRLPSTLLRSLDGATSERAPRGSVVFHAIRDYVPGDDRRYIHWRSTARTGTLKVREFVDTSRPDITVVLDNAMNRHTEASFEEAVEVVASLMYATVDAGYPTRLVLTDGTEFTPTGPNPNQLLLDRLAAVTLSPVASLEGTLDGLRTGGNTLCIVARDLTVRSAGLITAQGSAFHTLLLAVVDPDDRSRVEQTPRGVHLTRSTSAAEVIAEWNVRLR